MYIHVTVCTSRFGISYTRSPWTTLRVNVRGSLYTSQISHLLLYPSLRLLVPGFSSHFCHYFPYTLLLRSALVTNIFGKRLQDFVCFRNPYIMYNYMYMSDANGLLVVRYTRGAQATSRTYMHITRAYWQSTRQYLYVCMYVYMYVNCMMHTDPTTLLAGLVADKMIKNQELSQACFLYVHSVLE